MDPITRRSALKAGAAGAAALSRCDPAGAALLRRRSVPTTVRDNDG